ncbi:carboxylating nicotinate-nucleotide diphosphorylase [candidate division KSB1 bacterium]
MDQTLKLIKLAIEEDIGSGDITSESIVPEEHMSSGRVIAKESGILAGIEIFEMVFKYIDKDVKIEKIKTDGDRINSGDKIIDFQGRTDSILRAERTALNFLGHMSGIATETSRFVEKLKGTRTKILDTRKTKPGMRLIEKLAVKLGGGTNHRTGLFDMILIKENHISSVDSIEIAVEKAIRYRNKENMDVKIEVETQNLEEVKTVLKYPVDFIMLDNFNLSETKKAVELAAGKVKLESSGNVNLGNVRDIAETGVDYISVGAITHSAKSFDFSLLLSNKD